MAMPASPRALLIGILPTLRVADAFTSTSGIFEARAGLPIIGRLPPPSDCTCVAGMSRRSANNKWRNDARAKARICLEMQARRENGQADSNNNGDEATSASGSSRKVTQLDDGSPLGVAIVLLGGSWVVLGGGGELDAQISSLPPPLASFVSLMDGLGGGGDGGGATGSTDGRIWAVFVTASVAAGISRLVRYYWKER